MSRIASTQCEKHELLSIFFTVIWASETAEALKAPTIFFVFCKESFFLIYQRQKFLRHANDTWKECLYHSMFPDHNKHVWLTKTRTDWNQRCRSFAAHGRVSCELQLQRWDYSLSLECPPLDQNTCACPVWNLFSDTQVDVQNTDKGLFLTYKCFYLN